MFTVRLENHRAAYSVYRCGSYKVAPVSSPGSESLEIHLYKDESGADDPPFLMQRVGSKDPYRVAYISNQAGKTIDTIRSPTPPNGPSLAPKGS